ncbi:ABC transporter ATP-binding protein [Butyrivibrio sp. AE2032]|uniref:ABC transporter ATP-binding protein n=1 Tax=Butyrivibrio sp. AE2032 TaxID=1458463 RepID=UPI000551F247|nr:ABC transporter ATP-binding protein [Butyrivibrio sp. AE2032]
MNDVIFEARNLTKKYKEQYALNDVSISLKKNRIYGFIGENGAGKSTLMKIMAGLIFPTSGEMTFMGETDPAAIEQKRKSTGTMIEGPYLYPGYSVRQNVELQRILVGNPDESATDRVIELVGLEDSKKKKAKKLSMGMKQRLGIAMAMVGNPRFLILDEPINGLDPKNIVTLRGMLKKINEDNDCTIFVSSHILSELYLLATDFIFIHKGKIIETLTHEQLEEKCSQFILIRNSNIPETVTILEKHFPGTAYKVETDDTVKVFGSSAIMPELSGYLMKAGIVISELAEKEMSLEEYFISITGGTKE